VVYRQGAGERSIVNQATNHDGGNVHVLPVPHAFAFGKIDPREAGRRGGIASGLARRLKNERTMEARVLELRNGAAIYSVLRDRRQRDAELEAARRQADRELAEADLALYDARQQLDELDAQLRTLDERIAERERRLEASRSDEANLESILRDAGEARVEAACIRIGWLPDEDEP
jgi:hypothetical protein